MLAGVQRNDGSGGFGQLMYAHLCNHHMAVKSAVAALMRLVRLLDMRSNH